VDEYGWKKWMDGAGRSGTALWWERKASSKGVKISKEPKKNKIESEIKYNRFIKNVT